MSVSDLVSDTTTLPWGIEVDTSTYSPDIIIGIHRGFSRGEYYLMEGEFVPVSTEMPHGDIFILYAS